MDGFTIRELVNYAWTKLKTDINIWASTILTESNLIGYIYIPTSNFNTTFSNMDLATFNINYTVQIYRFDVQSNNQKGVCVGFTVTNNKNKVYIYVTKTEIDIINSAWDKLKDYIGSWASNKLLYSSSKNATNTNTNTNYTPVSF